jgi:RNA polymerase sigma-70 factor (ECF subfamily)
MDLEKLSAQELVQLCLSSQDEAPWFEFVQRFRPLIFGVVSKSLRRWVPPDRAVIDDLIQDTFLKLCANNFRALREFEYEHENSLFGFLKKVASNVVQDHIRSAYSQKRGSGREEEDIEKVSTTTSYSASFADEAHRDILIGEIKQCLDQHVDDSQFPRDSAIFWLYYKQGLTAKAISQIPAIGLTVKGVESTLLRLTRLVRAKLTEKPARRIASRG